MNLKIKKLAGGTWICEHEGRSILGRGRTKAVAKAAWVDDLIGTYNGLVNDPDERLSPDAIELREKLVGLFGEKR